MIMSSVVLIDGGRVGGHFGSIPLKNIAPQSMHAFGDLICKAAVRRSVFRKHLRYIAVSKDATSAVKPTTCVAPPSQQIGVAHLAKDPNGAVTLRKGNRPNKRHPSMNRKILLEQPKSIIQIQNCMLKKCGHSPNVVIHPKLHVEKMWSFTCGTTRHSPSFHFISLHAIVFLFRPQHGLECDNSSHHWCSAKTCCQISDFTSL